MKDGIMHVRGTSYYLRHKTGVYDGRQPKQREVPPMPDALQAVHRVRWSPNGTSQAAWLALGGQAGLVRVLRIA